jgi:hypothetical protein
VFSFAIEESKEIVFSGDCHVRGSRRLQDFTNKSGGAKAECGTKLKRRSNRAPDQTGWEKRSSRGPNGLRNEIE